MKKLNVLLALALMLMFTQLASAQITGSAHDFSSETWNTTGEICIVCHTPHNAMTGFDDAPLWNHELTNATFTLYATGTLDATMGQPDGSSKLCLSCHDGTVALENFGGVSGPGTTISGDALIGTDLSNDHPVSFTYNTALATDDGELADPSLAQSGLGGTIDDDMLISGKMQCSSCHDVHNTASINYMLLKSNSASALCLTCHVK